MGYYGDAFDRAKALLASGPLDGERVPGPPSAPLLVSGAELPPEVAQRLFPQGRTILAVTDAPSSGVAEVRHVPLGGGGLPSEVARAVDAGARSVILVGGTSAWSVLLLWHLWRRGVRTAIVARPSSWESRSVEASLASALLCKVGLLPLRVTARLRAGARAFTARSFMASPRLAQVVRRSRRVAGRVSPGRVDPQPWKAYADTVSRDRSVEPAPPFRVALYLGTMNAGGAERQHGNLAVGLRERGHDARLWTTLPLQGSDAHYGDLFLDRGVPVAQAGGSGSPEARWHLATTVDPRLVRSLPSALQTAVLDLAGELLRDPPHILHCTLDHTNVVGLAAGLLAGVPRIVLSTRNINPSNFVFFQPWMNPWYRFAATLPQVRFIANSRHGAQDYAEWMGVDPSRFAVIAREYQCAGISRSSSTAPCSPRTRSPLISARRTRSST